MFLKRKEIVFKKKRNKIILFQNENHTNTLGSLKTPPPSPTMRANSSNLCNSVKYYKSKFLSLQSKKKILFLTIQEKKKEIYFKLIVWDCNYFIREPTKKEEEIIFTGRRSSAILCIGNPKKKRKSRT